jgi:hypothetical protein
MKRKSGELSFEAILGMAFLAVFLTTIMAVYQFYQAQNPERIDSGDVVTSYNLILETIRNDARYADSMRMLSDGVELLEKEQLWQHIALPQATSIAPTKKAEAAFS